MGSARNIHKSDICDHMKISCDHKKEAMADGPACGGEMGSLT
jgi:hypothetical protein